MAPGGSQARVAWAISESFGAAKVSAMGIFNTIGISGAVLTLAIGFLVIARRHRKDYREYLAPDLQRHGLHFVSSRYPGLFRVGPFPIVEPRANPHVQTNVGSFVEYRVVACTDDAGQPFELWAKLDFQGYELQQLHWRAEHDAHVPDSARAMLEP